MHAPAPADKLTPPELLARVEGKPFTELPEGLFIPPEALKVFLEAFEGPLDLLLYLIRRHNLDILTINVAQITHQYIGYLDLMQELQIELAAEYLVMAALLAEIKSRSLLPRPPGTPLDEDDDEDPRAQLIRRLLEYEQFKTAAERLDALPRQNRDIFPVAPERPEWQPERRHPEVALDDLFQALGRLLHQADLQAEHAIHREPLSTRERMSQLLEQLQESESALVFYALFDLNEGRAGIVVTFIALLELVKEQRVNLIQPQPFAPIYIRLQKAQEQQEVVSQ